VQTIALIYADLLKSEKQGGVSASEQLLDNLLNKQGLSYDEFIINLQQ